MLKKIAISLLISSILFECHQNQLGADDGAARGYQVLTEMPMLTSDFNQKIFDQVWQSWPEPARSEAAKSSPIKRREMIFLRYGLTTRPNDQSGKPLQYVVDDQGHWTMNCFACHGGDVYGIPTPGAPNNRFAMQTMTEELRSAKFRLGAPLARIDLSSMVVPLGTTHGTTNAVAFGVGLMNQRDVDLNVVYELPQPFDHHDMDAPPWWYFYKRPYIYIDGFAEKGHRGLMQFTLIPENGPDFYREHEDNFRDVFTYLTSLRPPKFSGPIDQRLAEQGRAVFRNHCAECHGTYGDDWTYPNRRIPIDEIGTDPVRLHAIPVAGRKKYANSWFAHADEPDQQSIEIEPNGYVAPPLDGVWASAPYFHNGSVPTLWHVLHPDQRPTIWRRTDIELDQQRVGLQIEKVESVPLDVTDVALRRSYFDTRRRGKSNGGHDYPDALSQRERQAVLEYLKTL